MGAEAGDRTRVIIVDDSALMRATIRQMLSADPRIEVIDAAGSAPVAINKIRDLHPDVVTLDVEMPGMDGIELLKQIMAECPVPVIMLSAHTQHGAQRTLDALDVGAVDYVPKPTGTAGGYLRDVAAELVQKILEARAANISCAERKPARAAAPSAVAPSMAPAISKPQVATSRGRGFVATVSGDAGPLPVIAIGISCGGPATLMKVFPHIPANAPPILVTQHMPVGFTKSFAERLDHVSTIEVKEAENDDLVKRGRALIAHGDCHLTVHGPMERLKARLDYQPPVLGHRPSVDVMFRSVAKACGAEMVAVMMTGMGNDGAAAMGAVRAAGGHTIAQSAETCVVFGMPKAAIDMGHAEHIVPLEEIIPTMIELATSRTPVAAGSLPRRSA